jgi:hypothetical protein
VNVIYQYVGQLEHAHLYPSVVKASAASENPETDVVFQLAVFAPVQTGKETGTLTVMVSDIGGYSSAYFSTSILLEEWARRILLDCARIQVHLLDYHD